MKMLMNGKPIPPFNLATLPPPKGTPAVVEQLKQLSYLKYGRDRETVDGAIMAKYLSAAQAAKGEGAPSASRLVSPPMTVTTPAPLRTAPLSPSPVQPAGSPGSGNSFTQALDRAGISANSSAPQNSTSPHTIAQTYPEHQIAAGDSSPRSDDPDPYSKPSAAVLRHAAQTSENAVLFKQAADDDEEKKKKERPSEDDEVAELISKSALPNLAAIQRTPAQQSMQASPQWTPPSSPPQYSPPQPPQTPTFAPAPQTPPPPPAPTPQEETQQGHP